MAKAGAGEAKGTGKRVRRGPGVDLQSQGSGADSTAYSTHGEVPSQIMKGHRYGQVNFRDRGTTNLLWVSPYILVIGSCPHVGQLQVRAAAGQMSQLF